MAQVEKQEDTAVSRDDVRAVGSDAAAAAASGQGCGSDQPCVDQESRPRPRRRIARILGSVFAALLLVGGVGFAVYTGDYSHADRRAQEAVAGNALSQVDSLFAYSVVRQDDGTLVFAPQLKAKAKVELPVDATGKPVSLVFYPGGKVEQEAYAPLMAALAQRGVTCYLVRVPLNLAVLDKDAAQRVIDRGEVAATSCYVGGHSLGGAMAASFAAGHADELAGVVLLGAYAPDKLGEGLRVALAYGSEDGVLKRDTYEEDRANLPAGYWEKVIQGGNHARFGSYGAQQGDGLADLSPEQQTQQTADYLVDFFFAAA